MKLSNQHRERLDKALMLHRSGRLREAAELYQGLLRMYPDYPLLLTQMGTLALQVGNAERCIELLGRSLQKDPRQPEVLSNRAYALGLLNRLEEAMADYAKAIKLKPDHAAAFCNMGITLKNANRFAAALNSLDRAIALRPDYIQALVNKCNVLNELRRYEEALSVADRVLELNPQLPEAHVARGTVLLSLRRYDEAEACLDRAIALNPGHADAYWAISTLLFDKKQYEQALVCVEKVLSMQPENPRALNNKGSILRGLRRFDDALIYLNKAISINPTMAQSFHNRANVFAGKRELDRALEDYDHAIALSHDHYYPEASFAKGTALLTQGKLSEGWPYYEDGWSIDEGRKGVRPVTSRPFWDGQPVDRLFLWAEQGVGDEVFFASMFRDAQTRCQKLVVSVDERLLPLMRRSFPDIDFIDKRTPLAENDFDAHSPMGSLGRYFRNGPDDFVDYRKNCPYLKADRQRSSYLRAELLPPSAGKKARLIGISWRSGNPVNGAQRSVTLEQLAGSIHAGDPQVKLVNLQYGEVGDELAQLRAATGIEVLQSAEVNNFKDLDDFSALIQACDLVVSIDNSTVHFAGAMGVPVWVLLPFAADWRWQLDRTDSPWYPSARLFRQHQIDDWRDTLTTVTMELHGGKAAELHFGA